MKRGKASQAPVALDSARLDPSYELRLVGRDAWPLRDVAYVAVGLPLVGERDPVAEGVRVLLASGVEAGALPYLTCLPPRQPARVRVEPPRATGRLVDDMRSGRGLPFNKAHQTRLVPGARFDHAAVVRPADAVAFLRAKGREGMAARVAEVAEVLRARKAAVSVYESPEPGDWPANLTRCAPEVVAQVIKAAWAGKTPENSKGFAQEVLAKLEALGFGREVARDLHNANKPEWVRRGPRKRPPAA